MKSQVVRESINYDRIKYLAEIPFTKLDSVFFLQSNKLPTYEGIIKRIHIRCNHGTAPIYSNPHSLEVGHHQWRKVAQPRELLKREAEFQFI